MSATGEPFQRLSWIALLGCSDRPTDGVEDYCVLLGRALAERGITLERERVAWDEKGWIGALRELRRRCVAWHAQWVLLQYTAIAWSRRGFPFTALAAARIVRQAGARVAVVFHEPYRQGDSWPRLIDRVRGACQDWVIRRLYKGAAKCIFTEPLDKIDWLPQRDTKSVFIPIGANIPEATPPQEDRRDQPGIVGTVAVFCLTQPPKRQREVADISCAVRTAATSGLSVRVLFVGRGTPEAREDIERAFRGIPAKVSVMGLQSATDVSKTLADSDVMLCVRGRLSPRRGSAIAGFACGLPIVGYAGSAEGTPLAEGGVELVRYGDREALGAALTRVLTDANARRMLREKSVYAQRKYFSWDAIAKAFFRSFEAGEGDAEIRGE